MLEPVAESLGYAERVSSARTEALFIGLTLLSVLLSTWRIAVHGIDVWAVLALILFAMFLFYSLNYRVLWIFLNSSTLRLRFGLIHWSIALENIEACFPDPIPLRRIGGAGIHFTSIEGRYRAMFNFLEYPRLVVALKEKKGPVRDVVFSTRRPAELLRLLEESIAVAQGLPGHDRTG